MKVYSASTHINAAPDAVWHILTDARGYPEWDPSVERIEGNIAAGEKITAYTKLAPGRAFPAQVTAFEPGRKMIWSSGMPLGLFKGERSFTLTPDADGGTNFELREEFSGLLLGLIGRTIPDMDPVFADFAAGLKAKAEQATA